MVPPSRSVRLVSMRYPAPATVAMIQGSPRRLRRAETVMRTALVNGSAFSSHARLEELFGADDPAFGRDEDLEHGELLPRERDVAAVAVDLAAERVQPQAGDLPHGGAVVGAPAVERPQAEHELLGARTAW